MIRWKWPRFWPAIWFRSKITVSHFHMYSQIDVVGSRFYWLSIREVRVPTRPEPGIHGPSGPGILVWSEIFKFLFVLVRSGPRTRTEPLGRGPTGFGPWIPGLSTHSMKLNRKIILQLSCKVNSFWLRM